MLFTLLLTLAGGHTTGEGRRDRKGYFVSAVSMHLVPPSSGATVAIDSYTHNSIFTSGDSIPLGRQLILVCWVVGLPYGTPVSYTWTCPNGPCEVKGYYGRKIYNEHILAVNTTSTSDGGTYTCHVTATGGQETTGDFTFKVTGMSCTLLQWCMCVFHFPLYKNTFRWPW